MFYQPQFVTGRMQGHPEPGVILKGSRSGGRRGDTGMLTLDDNKLAHCIAALIEFKFDLTPDKKLARLSAQFKEDVRLFLISINKPGMVENAVPLITADPFCHLHFQVAQDQQEHRLSDNIFDEVINCSKLESQYITSRETTFGVIRADAGDGDTYQAAVGLVLDDSDDGFARIAVHDLDPSATQPGENWFGLKPGQRAIYLGNVVMTFCEVHAKNEHAFLSTQEWNDRQLQQAQRRTGDPLGSLALLGLGGEDVQVFDLDERTRATGRADRPGDLGEALASMLLLHDARTRNRSH